MMKMTSRNVMIILVLFSFFIITFYWMLSEITFDENKDEFFFRKFSKQKKNSGSREVSVETGIRSRILQAFQGYGMIAAKENNNSAFSTQLACASELFVTECSNAGLAAMLLMTLDHLSTCRYIGAVPTVFWRNCGTVCPANATVNSWNWFFEPLNPNVEERTKKVLCFGNYFGLRIISSQQGSKRTKSNHSHLIELLNLSFKPRQIPGFNRFDLITREIRLWANRLLKQYVKINPEIQEIVEKFYDKHLFGHTVLAVHVRGTDHGSETEDGKLPALTTWIQNAKHILKSLPTPNKIFIASDNSESIKRFVDEFGKKVVFAKAFRAVKYHGRGVHTGNYDPYKLGAEVLIDILLMAKADHFLHAESSVAAIVSYFNPEIHTHFLENKAETDNKDDAAPHAQFGHIGDMNVNMENVYNGRYSFQPESLVDEQEDVLECFQINSQYSACPNMRKAIFIDPRELQEL